MENNENQGNVIQFPGKKREAEQPQATVKPAAPEKAQKKNKKQKATLAGTVLAVIFATGAVNHYAFETEKAQNRMREIASVGGNEYQRDAKWEMAMAEKLASSENRAVAAMHVGRSPTLEEKLRLGTLDDVKYTFLKPDSHKIRSITLQGADSQPDYIGDRGQFLKEYGPLLDAAFASAQLKAVEASAEKSVEQYTLYDKDQRPTAEAHFELDKFKRLLSLKVEPIKI